MFQPKPEMGEKKYFPRMGDDLDFNYKTDTKQSVEKSAKYVKKEEAEMFQPKTEMGETKYVPKLEDDLDFNYNTDTKPTVEKMPLPKQDDKWESINDSLAIKRTEAPDKSVELINHTTLPRWVKRVILHPLPARQLLKIESLNDASANTYADVLKKTRDVIAGHSTQTILYARISVPVMIVMLRRLFDQNLRDILESQPELVPKIEKLQQSMIMYLQYALVTYMNAFNSAYSNALYNLELVVTQDASVHDARIKAAYNTLVGELYRIEFIVSENVMATCINVAIQTIHKFLQVHDLDNTSYTQDLLINGKINMKLVTNIANSSPKKMFPDTMDEYSLSSEHLSYLNDVDPRINLKIRDEMMGMYIKYAVSSMHLVPIDIPAIELVKELDALKNTVYEVYEGKANSIGKRRVNYLIVSNRYLKYEALRFRSALYRMRLNRLIIARSVYRDKKNDIDNIYRQMYHSLLIVDIALYYLWKSLRL